MWKKAELKILLWAVSNCVRESSTMPNGGIRRVPLFCRDQGSSRSTLVQSRVEMAVEYTGSRSEALLHSCGWLEAGASNKCGCEWFFQQKLDDVAVLHSRTGQRSVR